MATRVPLVRASDGNIEELPSGDTIDIGSPAWTPFSMSIHGTVSNPTKATTPDADTAYYSLNQKELKVRYLYSHTNNAGSAAGSGTYLFILPGGGTIDFSKMPIEMPVGSARFYSGSTLYQGQVLINQSLSSTAVFLEMGNEAQAFIRASDTAYPITGATVVYEFEFSVTIT